MKQIVELSISEPYPKRIAKFLFLVVAHFAVGTTLAYVVGFYPEARISPHYQNTALQPISPCIVVAAGLVGYLAARWRREDAACWVWLVGLLWLASGTFDLAAHWSPVWSNSTRVQYVLDNMVGLGTRCSASECLYEFLCTTPAVCSIVYSLVSWITLSVLGPK